MTERLYRSGKEKMVGGVCGGLADYFNIDVVLVRLITLLAFLMGGMGFLAYLVAWVIIPSNPAHQSGIVVEHDLGPTVKEDGIVNIDLSKNSNNDVKSGVGQRTKIAGGVLVVIGVLFLLDRWFPFFNVFKLWPLIFILIGLAIILRRDH